ncbi:MAG: HNH endonuclease [Acidimicrobiia bacterium]|nr:HNH endonuclease [Acidimicrobiia bacterium]
MNDAIDALEAANRRLDAGGLSPVEVNELLARYARAEKLAAYGRTVLAGRVRDAVAVARVTGTSVGAARRSVDTADTLGAAPVLDAALRSGSVSVDQAGVIARTEATRPGSASALVEAARTGSSFRALTDRARRLRLDVEDPVALGERQRRARRVRHRVTDEGMVHLDAHLEPHVGAGLVARLESVARRTGGEDPWEARLADALAAVTGADPTGSVPGAAERGRAEVVVLVSHEITQRDWIDVGEGEQCRIPGVGPVGPAVAKRIASDAFLSGVFFDGTDLRHLKRWTRSIPAGVRTALRLGDPPEFDGPACVDCGARFGLQIDHVDPVANGGPTSLPNSKWRCEPCHLAKTRQDRDAGLLTPRPPPDP